MKRANAGFTGFDEVLRHLGGVSLIVVILAAIAAPAFYKYEQRHYVIKVMAEAEAVRLSVEDELKSGNGPAEGPGYVLHRSMGTFSSWSWNKGNDAGPVIGYILLDMELYGTGMVNTMALERLKSGTWHCVWAGKYLPQSNLLEKKLLPLACDGSAMENATPG